MLKKYFVWVGVVGGVGVNQKLSALLRDRLYLTIHESGGCVRSIIKSFFHDWFKLVSVI